MGRGSIRRGPPLSESGNVPDETRVRPLFFALTRPARRARRNTMNVEMPYIPPNVYLLADNLDAALAAGEDIMKAALVWQTGDRRGGEDIARQRAAQRKVLETVRTLEEVLVARVLKSRERAEEIARHDPRFGTIARLYNAGTAMLLDAVGELGDRTGFDFETGGGGVAFLRSRGLVAEDAPGPAEGQAFAFSEDFLVAHRIRLGTLLDLVAMFLDALETHYDLFSDEAVEPELLPGEAPPEEDDADSLREALIAVRTLTALDQR